MKSRNGFTLVEILIVVVILGILAAIVVPQFTEASGEAKDSRLMSDLQTCRSQIELYKLQHAGQLPGNATGMDFEAAMTTYTMGDGSSAGTQAPGVGVYGPYLQKIANNPYTLGANGTVVTPVVLDPVAFIANSGWWMNSVTGEYGASTIDASGATTVNHFEW